MSVLKPKKPRKRAVVSVKEADGTWRELKTDPPPSDDPDVVALWDTPIGDLRKIVEDEKHPLHDKAVFVTERAFSPLTEALQEWFTSQDQLAASVVKPLEGLVKPIEALAPKLDSLVPKVDTSWISRLVPEYAAWRNLRRWTPQAEPIEAFVIDSIDFDSATPPEAPLSEVASAAGDAAVVVLQELLAVQREQLSQARTDAASADEALALARTSLTVDKSSRAAAWWAFGAAILAAAISVFGILVTLATAAP